MRLLTAKQVAERLNVSHDWVRDHSTRKKPLLPSIKLGDGKAARRYDEEAIKQFVLQHSENGL